MRSDREAFQSKISTEVPEEFSRTFDEPMMSIESAGNVPSEDTAKTEVLEEVLPRPKVEEVSTPSSRPRLTIPGSSFPIGIGQRENCFDSLYLEAQHRRGRKTQFAEAEHAARMAQFLSTEQRRKPFGQSDGEGVPL